MKTVSFNHCHCGSFSWRSWPSKHFYGVTKHVVHRFDHKSILTGTSFLDKLTDFWTRYFHLRRIFFFIFKFAFRILSRNRRKKRNTTEINNLKMNRQLKKNPKEIFQLCSYSVDYLIHRAFFGRFMLIFWSHFKHI